MTATDELRRLLDERGVEWTEPNNKARSHTTYWTAGVLRCGAVEFIDGMVSIASTSDDITPEQAIEATLGSDLEAENAKLREELAKRERLTAGINLPDYPISQFVPKDLERENAELRELVRISIEFCADGMCGIYEGCPLNAADGRCSFDDRARELGIEVDG